MGRRAHRLAAFCRVGTAEGGLPDPMPPSTAPNCSLPAGATLLRNTMSHLMRVSESSVLGKTEDGSAKYPSPLNGKTECVAFV